MTTALPRAGSPDPDLGEPTQTPRNTLAVVGFVIAASGVLIPIVVNSLAGGIVSAIALRRSRQPLAPGAAAPGSPATGRGLAMAGVLVGFIWGAVCLLGWAALIAMLIWVSAVGQNVQFPDSPVI